MNLRASFNRWRRGLLRRWLYRPLFGEVSHGLALKGTRISPATMIEHEENLVLGDNV